jgi:hypothetical protein
MAASALPTIKLLYDENLLIPEAPFTIFLPCCAFWRIRGSQNMSDKINQIFYTIDECLSEKVRKSNDIWWIACLGGWMA